MAAADTYMPIKNIDTKIGISYTIMAAADTYMPIKNIDTKTGISYISNKMAVADTYMRVKLRYQNWYPLGRGASAIANAVLPSVGSMTLSWTMYSLIP